MKRPRARLTSDGCIKVKVPGRKSRYFKVPFYDEYRRRAFRNLRYVLNQLNFKIDGEKVIDIYVDVKIDGKDRSARLKDKVILTKFPAEYPEYRIAFTYVGGGRFKLGFSCNDKIKCDAFEKFLRETFKPLYDTAFLNDTALKNMREEKVIPHEEVEEKPKVVKVKAQEEKIEAERPKRVRKRRLKTRTRVPKVEPSIEDVKNMIKSYKPRDFRERVAFERYREALATSPDNEDDIHRLFYKLIKGEKGFEEFYQQLYLMVPKLLIKVEHGVT